MLEEVMDGNELRARIADLERELAEAKEGADAFHERVECDFRTDGQAKCSRPGKHLCRRHAVLALDAAEERLRRVETELADALRDRNESELVAEAAEEEFEKLERDVDGRLHKLRKPLIFLLNRIASWTYACWDQHLRNEFGDERADEMIAAIRAAIEEPKP